MRALTATLWTVAVFIGVPHCASSIIDLSSKNLSSVPPDLPPSVEALDLSCNHIHTLYGRDFQETPHLIWLNLSWNGLEVIDPETFQPAPWLELLDLSYNRLQNLSDQRYLLHSQNLQDLDLTFNMFHTMALGREFRSLEKLRTLRLGAEEMRVGDFANIAGLKLKVLNLQLHDLKVYEEGSLRTIQANKVQIGMTNTPTDKVISLDALQTFSEFELIGLKGEPMYLSQIFKERSLVHTSHLYLTQVDSNWIQLTNTINAVFHSPIAHLTFTDVTINLPFLDKPVSPTSQTRSFNARRAVVTTFFFSQEVLYNFFINMPVEDLAIRETSLIHMTCPKTPSSIRQLDFSDCALTDTVFSTVVSEKIVECQNLNRVETLVLSGNNLKNLQVLSKRLQYMSSLHHLDLSLNSLHYNGLKDCLWPRNVTSLNLSSNGLSQDVFRCLPSGTVTLHLQNNQISTVPRSMLKLDSLATLDLSANRLRDLPVCVGFPNLEVLLLRKNTLHVPMVEMLGACSRLGTLDVSRNPFICTCGLRSFRGLGTGSWQAGGKGGHPIKLVNWPWGYRCSYPETLKNKTLEEFWVPEISCNVGLLAAAILCPAVALIVGVGVLCHRLDVPWYLGMIWQWGKAKHRARTQLVRPEDLERVVFHAFVSYSQKDAEWVKCQLLPNLEGSGGGLHICRHDRDFVPGRTIPENIIHSIERSRRCVFILSAHFVRSEWCHYELCFASHQHLACSQNVILVLLEPLPQYLVPSKYNQLKALMNRHTYLEWPQDRAKHRLFWANLRAALQADLPNAPLRDMDE